MALRLLRMRAADRTSTVAMSLMMTLLPACRGAKPEGGEPGTSSAVAAVSAPAAAASSMYCPAPTTLVADEKKCVECQAANCNASLSKGCDALKTPEDVASCNKILTCLRSTDCLLGGGAVNCYCGPSVDIVTCKSDAAKAEGACKAQITSGYPPGSTASFIIDNSTREDMPGSLAMAIGQCDYQFCGPPAVGGESQCAPYCKR